MSDPTAAEMKSFNQQIIDEFRANGGRTTGPFAGAPLLLLTSTGAKSGQPRTSPVVHTRDGDRYVIIASKAGADTNPNWYHNLVAHPRATVEVGADTIEVEATVAEGDERTRLYDAQAALMPTFDEYQAKTSRQIPVIILTPVA
jgi:deazaflavin-dependent oxidoreductase (nitroreductase family)